MTSAETSVLLLRARRAYEWSRLRRAAIVASPVWVMVLAALAVTTTRWLTLLIGAQLFVLSMLLLWRGQEHRRAVLSGLLAGGLLSAIGLVIHYGGQALFGPDWQGNSMMVCAVGGSIAGVVIAWAGISKGRSLWYWVSSSAMVVLIAALACTVLGWSMLVGSGLGYLAGIALASLLMHGPRSSDRA